MLKKKLIIIISLALIVGFSGIGTTVFIFYENIKKFSGHYEISEEGKTFSDLEIDYRIQKGNINFMTLAETSSNILEANWTLDYQGFNDPSTFIIISFEEHQSTLKIFCSLNAPGDVLNLDLTIAFNPNYNNYSFKSDSGVGNINFNTHQINYSVFEIKTRSGNIDIKLNKSSFYNDFKLSTDSGTIDLILDHSVFYKDISCTSESGNQYIDIWNIQSNSHSNFNITSSTGRIRVIWANHYIKSSSINVYLNSLNDVYIKMWTPREILRYDIYYEAINGTTQFSSAHAHFVQIGFNHYQSYNFNTSGIDQCNISAITNYGHVHVYIVDCFKWQRFCRHNVLRPYDVHTSGENVIPKTGHNVTTVEFYNMKYIYLNTFKYLDINFLTLPDNSSENIIQVVWDLTYTHATGIGVGIIDALISNKTEGNTLKLYFELEYELDRIIPTFTNSNITVFIDPDYSFYNYTQ